MGRTASLANTDAANLSSGWGFRNRVINGGFAINQRGGSLAASTGFRYGVDRWAVDSVGTTIGMAQQAFTLGQTDVPNASHYLRMVVSSITGASNYAEVIHRVEGVRSLAGSRATVTFWAKASTSRQAGLLLSQIFGSGGSPSAANHFSLTTVNLTTAWQKFSISASIPSIAGKTLGSNGDDFLQLALFFDAGSSLAATAGVGHQSGTFDLANVQIEDGDETGFEWRPQQVELALCQRYFESGHMTLFGVATGASQDFRLSQRFAVTKRAAPTLATSGGSTSNVATSQVVNPTADRFDLKVVSTASGAFTYDSVRWNASSEL